MIQGREKTSREMSGAELRYTIKRGALTGAQKRRTAVLARAMGGVLGSGRCSLVPD